MILCKLLYNHKIQNTLWFLVKYSIKHKSPLLSYCCLPLDILI